MFSQPGVHAATVGRTVDLVAQQEGWKGDGDAEEVIVGAVWQRLRSSAARSRPATTRRNHAGDHGRRVGPARPPPDRRATSTTWPNLANTGIRSDTDHSRRRRAPRRCRPARRRQASAPRRADLSVRRTGGRPTAPARCVLLVVAVAVAGLAAASAPPNPPDAPLDAVLLAVGCASSSSSARWPRGGSPRRGRCRPGIAVDPLLMVARRRRAGPGLWVGASAVTRPVVLAGSLGITFNVLARAELYGFLGLVGIVTVRGPCSCSSPASASGRRGRRPRVGRSASSSLSSSPPRPGSGTPRRSRDTSSPAG